MQNGGIGLMSMRERLRFCGGMLTVKSAPNQGTEIAAAVVAVKAKAATAST
jgi:signal transduction histidine kinase